MQYVEADPRVSFISSERICIGGQRRVSYLEWPIWPGQIEIYDGIRTLRHHMVINLIPAEHMPMFPACVKAP